MSESYGNRSAREWPFPHRFVQHSQVATDALCGVEKYPGENPGVVCGEGPTHPLHDQYCSSCRCVVSGAHSCGQVPPVNDPIGPESDA